MFVEMRVENERLKRTNRQQMDDIAKYKEERDI